MNLTSMRRGYYGETRIITLEISDHEIMKADLTPFDRLLLDECRTSNKISDQLLALETLTRKIEESAGSSSETVQRKESK